MKRLEGKKAIVTGGSSGIGQAIALGFAAEGADVVITYLNGEKAAEEVIGQIKMQGRRTAAFKVDLTQRNEIDPFIEKAIGFLGEVDILVNNAGILTRSPFLKITPEELDQVINLNLMVPFLLTQAVAREMIKRNIHGNIINISSISDHVSVVGLSHYQCSKAGLTMLTRGAAYELAPAGIRVNAIAPGLTATGLNKDLREKKRTEWQSRSMEIPIGRTGVPEDHVGAAIFLCTEEASWITGACIPIDGGRTLI